jgi:hypothetical protein
MSKSAKQAAAPAVGLLPTTSANDESSVYRKVSWRLLPFLMLC